MKSFLKTIISIAAVVSLVLGAFVANATVNFTPVQTSQPSYLYLGVNSTVTSVRVSGFSANGVTLTMANFGTKGYGTLDPNSSLNSETIDFTGVTNNLDGTVTLTGVDRGISNTYPYAASSANAKSHAASSIFIVSNTAQFYSNFVAMQNDVTITGLYNFSTQVPTSSLNATTSTQLVNYQTLMNTAIQGAATSTETHGGIVQLATQGQQAASTDLGVNTPLVLQAKYATSTYNPATSPLRVVVTGISGTIDHNFIATSTQYNWTGLQTFSTATTTFNATTSISATANTAPLRLNGVNYGFPASQGASSTALMNDGNGNVNWYVPAVSVLGTNNGIFTAGTSTVTIPSGSFNGTKKIHVVWYFKSTSVNDTGMVRIGSGSSTSTIQALSNANGTGMMDIFPTGASNEIAFGQTAANTTITGLDNPLTLATAANIYIAFGASNATTFNGFEVTLINQ